MSKAIINEIVNKHFERIYQNRIKPIIDENGKLEKENEVLRKDCKRYRDMAQKMKKERDRAREVLKELGWLDR